MTIWISNKEPTSIIELHFLSIRTTSTFFLHLSYAIIYTKYSKNSSSLLLKKYSKFFIRPNS
ncbi:hypothetical protein LINPERHAP2_LOCUS42636, partial [Linum perenne]